MWRSAGVAIAAALAAPLIRLRRERAGGAGAMPAPVGSEAAYLVIELGSAPRWLQLGAAS
jgi:hypothetical protein